MELDRIPLWRGDHVTVKQLAEDFARYLYLPRLKNSPILVNAICEGVALLTWQQDGFALADSFDEAAGRYRGLRAGRLVTITDADSPALVVKPDVARKQLDAESKEPSGGSLPGSGTPGGMTGGGGATPGTGTSQPGPGSQPSDPPNPGATQPKRFHGTVELDSTRVGRDASRIADEVIAHLAGLVGATVKVTLEVEAEIPSGAPDNVVRTVTENSRTLKFTSHGFEKE